MRKLSSELRTYIKKSTTTSGSVLSALVVCFSIVFLGALSGCKSAQKADNGSALKEAEGKKVALVSLDGGPESEPTAQKIIEVALINQLIKHGTFIVIPKQDIDSARSSVDINPADGNAIARKVGADLALRVKIITFEATTITDYRTDEIEDPQWEQERGEKTRKRTYKVKVLKGKVKVELSFTNVGAGKSVSDAGDNSRSVVRTSIVSGEDQAVAELKTEAQQLPPKLSFLERIANDAFKNFFDKYE